MNLIRACAFLSRFRLKPGAFLYTIYQISQVADCVMATTDRSYVLLFIRLFKPSLAILSSTREIKVKKKMKKKKIIYRV